jgi:hypothetical protein
MGMQHDLDEEAQKAACALTLWQKAVVQAQGVKLYLGHEQREGWSGKLPFYLFHCETCGNWAKDYPHGYVEERHLNCSYCGMYHEFVPLRTRLVVWWRNISSRFDKAG